MPSVPTFPSIDLSQLDLSKIDLSKIDLSKLQVAGIDTDKVLGVLRDAAYVVIGFGVLTVQQVQVRRRELTAKLSEHEVTKQLGLGKDQVDELVKALGERLPEQAGTILGQAHEVAKAARKQVRGLLVNAA